MLVRIIQQLTLMNSHLVWLWLRGRGKGGGKKGGRERRRKGDGKRLIHLRGFDFQKILVFVSERLAGDQDCKQLQGSSSSLLFQVNIDNDNSSVTLVKKLTKTELILLIFQISNFDFFKKLSLKFLLGLKSNKIHS